MSNKGKLDKDKLEKVLLSRIKVDPSTGCWNYALRPAKSGYGGISYMGKGYLAHRLAAYVWLDFDYTCFSYKTKSSVCHKCDNKLCINPAHLFIGTYRDNIKDMLQKNRSNHAKGSRVNTSKLSEKQVLEIIELCKTNMRYREIANKYKVTIQSVHAIGTGKNWKHLSRLKHTRGRGCFSKGHALEHSNRLTSVE